MASDLDLEFAAAADHAFLLRELGLQVVPSLTPRPGEQWKRPSVPWKTLEHNLVDHETFDGWFGSNGSHVSTTNIGLITGACSGRVVGLDLDFYKNLGAREWWDGYCQVHNNGMDLETLTQETGGGGLTKFFRWPAGRPMPTAHKSPIGVDIRGQGGFIVVAPSLHESGTPYRWRDGFGLGEAQIEDAPTSLCEWMEALIAQYGRAVTEAAAVPGSNVEFLPTAATGKTATLAGEALDGREDAMFKLVWAACVDMRRECPILPTEAESRQEMGEAFQRYLSSVSPRSRDAATPKHIALEREGRGITLFTEKWDRAMSQWNTALLEAASVAKQGVSPYISSASTDKQGVSPYLRATRTVIGDLGEEITYDAETGEIITPAELQATPEADEFAVAGPRTLRRYNIDDLMRMPKATFLVEGVIIANGLGFLSGPPGCGKSFVMLDLALSLAHGLPTWLGRPLSGRPAGVLYLAGEGSSGAKHRVMAWRNARKPDIRDGVPFEMIFESLNFMSADDGDALMRAVQAHVEEHGRTPAMVVVDTVSRVLPGAKENQQEDMTLFIQACDAIRERFGCCVVGVHHVAKGTGSMRGSGVLSGAADFVLGLTKASPDDEDEVGALPEVTLRAEKIKDAPDGWATKLELRPYDCLDIEPLTSLVPELKVEGPVEDSRPRLTVYEKILQDLREASAQARPWRDSYQSKERGLNAVKNIVGRYGLTEKQARSILDGWLLSGVVTFIQKKDKGAPEGWASAHAEGYHVTGMLGDGSGSAREMAEREGVVLRSAVGDD